MTMDSAFQILLALVACFGGLWIRRLGQDINDLEKAVERIRSEYQRREDAKSNFTHMMEALREVRAAIDRIDTKLDKKADKS
ncbi:MULTISPECIES: hypothetical protein [Hafniaceae]|uniref:hypothetical protein n=1 Tax=Hafniaceae TaxID=1903412 RepID=UPI001CF4E908|nr:MULTISPECIES: hypothetical protein [Hafniaceae]MCQ4171727.1 hypothetical protein [Hafnia paralvei]